MPYEELLTDDHKTMIPSTTECLRLMEAYHMLDNIRAHSIMVAKVARLLTRHLNEVRQPVSMERVVAGALLHDIAKTETLTRGGDHTALGRTFCLASGLDEIAEIVAQHVVLKSPDWEGPVSEIEIVYYSDKRVNHDRVVSLEERLSYILDRYGRNREAWHEAIRINFAVCKRVEDRIFQFLPFPPGDVAHMALVEPIPGRP